MSQSRALRFTQIRLVTDSNRIEPLRDIARLPVVRARTRHWPAPTAPSTSTDAITLPEIKEPNESKEFFDGNFEPPLPDVKVLRREEIGREEIGRERTGREEARPDETGREDISTDGDGFEVTSGSRRKSARDLSSLQSHPLTLDEADQKVSINSTMSLVRSIVADEGIRAIADSIARISNDEANDRNGPWYFEMSHATHMLPMTVLSIELSRGEILLRFISSDAASVRLISDRKEDLRALLENRLSPPRSIQIEIISE